MNNQLRVEDFNNEVKKLITLSEKQKITTSRDPLELFKASILDQTKNYPAPEPVINLIQNNEVMPFMTKKAFSLWQGKQKSKKTTALAIAVAAFISNKSSDDNVRFKCADPGVVLFFDTEQGESYAARTMGLILKLANLETSPNLKYSDLRVFDPRSRFDIIKAGIKDTNNVKLIVIDGIIDLMVDFMDAAEGMFTVTELIKLSSEFNIHIAGVLHQNKGQSKDARAHVGTISSQKCEIEVMAEVDPEDMHQSIISCKASRDFPFEPFAIRWDKGELPKIVQGFELPMPKNKTIKYSFLNISQKKFILI